MIIPPDIFINKPLHSDDLAILQEMEDSEEILYEYESEFNNISIVQNKEGRFLKFGDSYQAGIINHPFYKGNLPYLNYFLLACLMHRKIKNVLFLGMGSGRCINILSDILSDVKNIDIVDIEPKVIDLAQEYFGFQQHKNMKIHIQDARVFLRTTKKKYDLIFMDIFSEEGISYRFLTEEFLLEASTKLTEKGIFIANLFTNDDLKSKENIVFKSIYKTYRSVFKKVQLYPTLYGNLELYKGLFNLKYHLSDLTNIILFASNSLMGRNLEIKAVELQQKYNIPELHKLDLYLKDKYTGRINTKEIKILKDCYEQDERFTLEKIKSFLQIDHKANIHMGKINPVDDEKKALNSE